MSANQTLAESSSEPVHPLPVLGPRPDRAFGRTLLHRRGEKLPCLGQGRRL